MQIWTRTYEQTGALKGYLNLDSVDQLSVEQFGRKWVLVAKGGYVQTVDHSWEWSINQIIWPESFERKDEALEMLERFMNTIEERTRGEDVG